MSVQFKNKMSLYDMNEELKKCLRTDVTTNQEINGLIKLKNIDLNNQNSYVTKNFIIKNEKNVFPYKNIIMINAKDYDKYFNDETKTWTLKDLMKIDGLYNNYYNEINDNILVNNIRIFLVTAGDVPDLSRWRHWMDEIRQGNYYYSDVIQLNNISSIKDIVFSNIHIEKNGDGLNNGTSITLNNNQTTYSCKKLETQKLPVLNSGSVSDYNYKFTLKEILKKRSLTAGFVNFSYIPHSGEFICGMLPRAYLNNITSGDERFYPYFICDERERPIEINDVYSLNISLLDPVSYGTSFGFTMSDYDRDRVQYSKSGDGLICIYF